MDHLAGMVGKKLGEMVEGAVLSALGGSKDKDKDKDKDEGNFFSKMFNKDDDDDNDENRKKRGNDDDDKGNFFSKMLNRDDDDDGKEKAKGFDGMWHEPGGPEGSACMGGGAGGGGQSIGLNDGDLMNDLMEVAAETSQK